MVLEPVLEFFGISRWCFLSAGHLARFGTFDVEGLVGKR